jgi:hypothetical protein
MQERQIGLVKMKRDRYIAREAASETGMLRTPLVVLPGPQLTINVEPVAGGEVRVQVVGADDQPIKGFSFEDCQPITADQDAARVQWGGGMLADLKGKPVRLEFSLKDARLYAFESR